MTAPGTGVPSATGASAWALGLLVLLPIPMLGSLAAGGAMVAAYGSLSRQGPLAKANAAAARVWGRWFLITSTALLVLQLVFMLPRMIGASPAVGFLPLGIPLLLYVLACAVHLVVVVVATLRARGGHVFTIPPAGARR